MIMRLVAGTGFLLVAGCSLFQPKPEVTPVERVTDSGSAERGGALLSAGRLKQAAVAYRASLAKDPANLEARFGLAEALRLGGEAEASKAEYLVLSENPDWRARALEGLGQANLVTGDHNGAFEALSAATEADPNAWRAWVGLAQLRDLARDWENADAAYAAALAASDNPALVLNNQGVSMLARGDAAGSSALFRRALEADPTFVRAATNLELATAAQSGLSLEELAASEPDVKKRAQKLNNYGYVAMLQGRYDEAERLFDAAIKAHPSFYALAFENKKTLAAMRAAEKK